MNTIRCHLVRDIIGYETVVAVLNLPAVPREKETLWVTPKTGGPNRFIVSAIGYHGRDVQGEATGSVSESYVIVEVTDPPRT